MKRNIDDVIRILKPLEILGVLIEEFSEAVKPKIKIKEDGFIGSY